MKAAGHSVQRVGFMDDFRCTGPQCPDTCCHGWSMQVDELRLARYAQLPDIGLEAVVDSSSGPIMKKDAQTWRCLQLVGGSCGIHARHGTDLLSDACHFYPRVLRDVGGEIQLVAVMSCPEVARLALYGSGVMDYEPAQLERLPIQLNAYVHEMPPGAARAATQTTVQMVAEAPTVGRALVQLKAMAMQRPDYAWPQRRVQTPEGPWPAADFHGGDVQRILQVLVGLLHSAEAQPGAHLQRLVLDMRAALGVRIDPTTFDLYGPPDAVQVAARVDARWPALEARLRQPLTRWLQAQLLLSSFPWAGLAEGALDKVHLLGLKFGMLRLGLLASVEVERPSPEDVTRVVQALSRGLDHLSQAHLSLALMRQMDWLSISRFRGLVGDVSG